MWTKISSVLALLAVAVGLLVVPDSPRANAASAGQGQFAFRMFGGADDPNRIPTASIPKYSYYMLSPYMVSIATKVRQNNPSAKIYMYKDASSMRRNLSDPSSTWCSTAADAVGKDWGIEYCDAVTNHANWFLTKGGNKFEYSGYAYHWHANVTAAGYKEQWAANVIKNLKANSVWSGVLVDNQLSDITAYVPNGAYPDQFSSKAAGQEAYQIFIDYVSQQITAAGYGIAANTSARLFPGLWDRYARYQSGAYDEWWTTFGGTDSAPNNLAAYGDVGWQAQVAEVESLGAAGKFGIFGAQTANGACNVCALYGYASYLLGNNGSQYFMEGNVDAQMSDWVGKRPMYSWDLGTPTSGRTEIQGAGTYLFQRNFSGGTVIVNANGSTSRTVNLGGTFLNETGAQVTSVTLAPLRATILRSTQSTTTTAVPTTTTSVPPTTTTTTTAPPTTTTTTTTTTVAPPTTTTAVVAADLAAPTAPTGLRTTVQGRSVTLRWTASTDNVGVAAYRIFRNGTLVATVAGSATSYVDSGLSRLTMYSYYVRAVDAAGNVSANSNTVSARTRM